MSNLKIFSYNCRGLNKGKKRSDIFNLFKDKNSDILCLQETHFVPEIEKNIYSEWNGKCFFNHGKSNAKGVAVLLKTNLNIKIEKVHSNNKGNMLIQ